MAISAATVNVQFDSKGVPQVTTDLKNVGSAVDGADKKSQGFWSNALAAGTGFLGANVFGKLASGITGFATSSVTAGMDFEAQMSAVQAVTGATGEEFKSLQDLALKIGKDTSFGAGEAAMAIEELAKAGVSTENILNGAADATTALAAAGGVDLPSAASVMSAAMNQFGIAGDQSMMVADLLAAASAKSATGVLEMGESLKYVGTTASALGYPIQDVTTALAMMADQGMVGSMAGTSLNSMLSSLANPTDQAATLMGELGLSFKDTSGELKDMPTLINDVAAATADMTDADRAATLEKLFGVEGGRAMNAMLASTSEQAKATGKTWKDYYDAVTESGVASEQAAARLNNAKGDIDNLKGTLETISIMAMMAFLPAIRGAIQGVTKVLGVIPEWISLFQNLMGQGMSPMDAASLALRSAIENVFGEDVLLKMNGFITQFFSVLQTVIDVGQAIAGVIMGVLGAAFSFLGDHMDSVIAVAIGLAGALAGWAAITVIGAILTGIGIAIAAILSPIGLLIIGIAALSIAFQSNFLGIRDIVMSVLGALAPALSDLQDLFQDLFSGDIAGAVREIGEIFQDLGDVVTGLATKFPALSGTFTALGAMLTNIGSAFFNFAKAIRLAFAGDFSGAFKSVQNGLKLLGSAFLNWQKFALNAVSEVASMLQSAIGGAFDWLAGKFPAFASTFGLLGSALGNIVGVVKNVAQAFSALLSGDLEGFFSNLGQAAIDAGQAILSGLMLIPALIIDVFQATDWGAVWEGLKTAANAAWGAIQGGASAAWDALKASFSASGIGDAIGKAISGALDGASGLVAGAMQGISDAAMNALNVAGDFVMDQISLAWDAITSLDWGDFIDGIGDLGAWLLSNVAGIADFAWSTFITGSVAIGSWLKETATNVASFAWSGLITGSVAIGTWLKETATNVATFAWTGLITGTIEIGSWLATTATNVSTFLWTGLITGSIEIGSWLAATASNVATFAWSGLIRGSIEIGSWLGGIAGDVKDFAWSTFISGSIEIGTWLAATAVKVASFDWMGIVRGFVDIPTWLASTASNIATFDWTGVVRGFVDVPSWLAATASNIATFDWMGIIQNPITDFGSFLSGLIDPFPDWPSMPSTEDVANWFISAITGSLPSQEENYGGDPTIQLPPGNPFQQAGSGALGAGGAHGAVQAPDTSGVIAALAAVTAAVSAETAKWALAVISAGGQVRAAATAAFSSILGPVQSGMTAAASAIRDSLTQWVQQFTSSGASIRSQTTSAFAAVTAAATSGMSQFRAAVTSGIAAAESAFSSGASQIRSAANSLASALGSAGNQGGNSFASGIRSGMSSAVGAAQDAIGRIRGAVSGFDLSGEGYGIGSSLGQGIAAGIAAWVGIIAAQAANAVSTAIQAAKNAGAIASPSRIMRGEVGAMLGLGAVLGLGDQIPAMAAMAASLTDAAQLGPIGSPLLGSPVYGVGYGSSSSPSYGTPNQAPVMNQYNTFLVMDAAMLRDLPDTIQAVKAITDPDTLRVVLGEN